MLTGTHVNSRQDQVVYGRPALEAVQSLAAAYGARRLLLTTTRSLEQPAQMLARGLGDTCVGVFAGIAAHSPREAVIEGASEARRTRADLLLALGGGSVIDATKVMQLCVWCEINSTQQLDGYRVGGSVDRRELVAVVPTLQMIALPTTLSAAEFTPFAGVTDVQRHAKHGYAHPSLAPRAVVLDPALTLNTPTQLWLSTGMKAVDHAVEQLCNPERAPYADALAEDGLSRLSRGLVASQHQPSDLDARLECQFGMWLAIAGASAGRGIGASHAIGHTLGGMFGVPHGVTSCLTLHAVLRWNAAVNAERQRAISQRLGAPDLPAGTAIKQLCQRLGLPTQLASAGIEPSQFRAIAEHTMHDRGIRANPRPIRSPDDIVEILELARA